jgi:3-oxoadipate enol-lactonase
VAPVAPVADPPGLPAGRPVLLPGRGTTWVRRHEGPSGAPTLVLLHGWTVNAALNWFATFAPLAPRFDVIALDHRGHGRGIRTWRRFRLEDCADDVIALADVLGLERIIPVGYSMGGPIAQLVWKRHPSRVDGLVLCATAARFAAGSEQRLGSMGLGGLAVASRLTPRVMQRQFVNRVIPSADAEGPERWAREQVRRHDLTAVLEAGRAVGQFSSMRWIGGVDVPTAVVVTTRDSLVPVRRQLALADAIPGATGHLVEADHDAAVFAADRFVPALLEACGSVSSRIAVARA